MTNLYIPKEDKTTTEIDLIMISKTGIYVFESRTIVYGSSAVKIKLVSKNVKVIKRNNILLYI